MANIALRASFSREFIADRRSYMGRSYHETPAELPFGQILPVNVDKLLAVTGTN